MKKKHWYFQFIQENIPCTYSLESPYLSHLSVHLKYRIQPNYRTCFYKRTVKQFRSLQITTSVIFVYFFIEAYVVGTHLNCIDLSMQFVWVPTTYTL